MSDIDRSVSPEIPLLHGPITPAERREQEQEQERKAKEQSDRAFQNRQVLAVEAANRIAARNTTLTGIAALISLGVLVASFYQYKMSQKSWQAARETLQQMKADSLTSGQQFQVQLRHFDDGLGRTGLLAQHAGEQAAASRRLAEAAKSTSETARSALNVENRPWLSMEVSLNGPLVFDSNGAHVPVAYQLKNLGHTTAINSVYRADVVTLPEKTWMAKEIRDAELQECSLARQQVRFAGSIHLIPPLFPDQGPWQAEWTEGISKEGIKKALEETNTGPLSHKGYVRLFFVACVDYELSFGDSRHHQTGSGFFLGIPEPNGTFMGDLAPKGTQGDVRLIPTDSFAN